MFCIIEVVGEIYLKAKSSTNSEIFSTKFIEKGNIFITTETLNQNKAHIIGNLLRDCKDGKKSHPFL